MNYKNLFTNHSLNKIYLSETLRNFTLALIEIFIPIYLLTLGYSLTQVLLFYVYISITHILLAIPVGKFGARFSFSSAILVGVPFQVLFFILLYSLETHNWPLLALAIIKEIGATFYWVGRHVFLAKYTQDKQRGTQLGVGKVLVALFSLPSPLIGGAILMFYGIKPLLLLVLFFLTISVIPLFLIKRDKQKTQFKTKHLFSHQSRQNVALFLNHGVDNVMTAIVWPTYVFFAILTKYIALGFVTFLSQLFSVASNYIIGRWFDKSGKVVLKYGGIASFFIWIARYFSTLNIHVYLTDSAQGISQQSIYIPFNAISYEFAKKSNIIHFIVSREILIHSGKLLALILLIIINDLKTSLILGMAYSLIYVFIKFSRKE